MEKSGRSLHKLKPKPTFQYSTSRNGLEVALYLYESFSTQV